MQQLKVQYIDIFEEIDPFYWPKMHFLKWKRAKNSGMGSPPPLIRAMPKRKRLFFIDVFPNPTSATIFGFTLNQNRGTLEF